MLVLVTFMHYQYFDSPNSLFQKKCSMACPRQSGVFGEVNVCDNIDVE